MNEEVVVHQEPEEEVQEMGAVERIIGVYFSPRKTFEYLRGKPKWLVPFIIICLIALLSNYLVRDIGIQEQIERVQMSERLTEEQKDQYIERIQSSTSGWQSYIQLIATPVVIFIIFVVVAGIFLFFGNMLFGGQANFRQVLSVYAYAGLVAVPSAIVKIPLMLAQGTTRVQTSLAVLLSADAEGTMLYRLLSKFCIFSIWEVILLIIGISVIYRFSGGKASTMVLIVWALWIIVSVALGGVFRGLGFA
jgi:hypothetical protein